MRRLRRLLTALSWLVVVALVPPTPLASLVEWIASGVAPELAPAASALVEPSPAQAAVAQAPATAALPNAWPPERRVIQSPEAKELDRLSPIKPSWDISGGRRGPGAHVRLERPGEPIIEVGLRLRPQDVGTTRTASTQNRRTTIDIADDSNNTYGARMEVRWDLATDDRSAKETILLHGRPRTNVLAFDLEARGLTPNLKPDGSLELADHTGQPAVRVPRPTFKDAAGRSGTAAYRLPTDNRLEIVLDSALLASGSLPLEVDPPLEILAASDLLSSAPPPWQRTAAIGQEGVSFFAYYDPSDQKLKFVTSLDLWTTKSAPTNISSVTGLGASGFSIEHDAESDRIFVAVTGIDGANKVVRLHVLSYDSVARTWTVGAPIDVATHATNAFSGATLTVERVLSDADPQPADYLWIGADEQSGSTYTYKTWHATLLDGVVGSTWTMTTPGLGATSYAHYGSVVAITNGAAAVGRGASTNRMWGAIYTRGSGWGSVEDVTERPWNNGRDYSAVAVADPLDNTMQTFVPMVAKVNESDNDPNPIQLVVRRIGLAPKGTGWQDAGTSVGGTRDAFPQLLWTGSDFQLFYIRIIGGGSSTNRQINARRGHLVGTPGIPNSANIELENDRPWIIESATGDRNLKWLSVRGLQTSDTIPFHYIRDKTTDQLMVQTRKVDMLGERASWQYQEIKLPGAGIMKVNLANGNMHYEMDDASLAARRWNDTIKRAYDSQSDLNAGTTGSGGTATPTIFGDRWAGLANPALHFYSQDTKTAAWSKGKKGTTRVVYWTGDGGKYVYVASKAGGDKFTPEFGMKMDLKYKNQSPADKRFQLTDLYGATIYFTEQGKPTLKEDKPLPPVQVPPLPDDRTTWTWTYNPPLTGKLSTITAQSAGSPSPGRTQTFTIDANNRVTQISLAGLNYTYAYTNGRLTSATRAAGTPDAATVTYGYHPTSGLLTSITSPVGNVYSLDYTADNRVLFVDLPDPTTGAASNCGKPTGQHCWDLVFNPGQGEMTLTDPRSNVWITKALGSGPVYEIKDPQGNTTSRTWTGDQNKASETDPLGNMTVFEYDVKANRTKIIDPVNGSLKPTLFAYNSDNRRVSKTDTRVNSTNYTYEAGGLDKETDAEGKFVDHNYDQTTRDLTEVIDARGKSKTRTYEQSSGLLLTENRPDGSKTSITRDSQGRPSQTKIEGTAPGLEEMTVTTYDNLGRLTASRVRMASTTADDPTDLVTVKSYDRDGNLLTVTDPKGNVTTYSYDRRGRLVAVESPGATDTVRPCTTYSYDQVGNQTTTRVAISRPAGAVCAFGTAGITWSETTRAFDPRNLKTSETLVAADYPGNIITAWQFDAAGRTTKVTDPRGNFVDYTYDGNNRKLSETGPSP